MSKADSVTLWRRRFQSKKLNDLKVNDWCEKINISRHTDPYWHRKLISDQ